MGNLLLLPLVAIFLSVALGAGALAAYAFRRLSPVDRRLRGLADAGAPGAPGSVSDLDLATASYGALNPYARLLPKSRKEMSALRRRVTAAGFDRPEAVVLFALAEIGLPLAAAAGAFLWIGPPRGILAAVFAGALGYLVPGLWLGHRVTARRRQIENGLPDALDLLLVSIEAGSGLDQALAKVAAELQIAYPALAHELRHIITEIRAGRPRAEALRQFAERSRVDDVKALVLTMIQTDRFGTSIAQALRTHADTARVKRRQRAEERAAKLGVKLVFPLVFCLFPAMFVVVLGPAVLRIMRVLGPMVHR